MPKSDLTDGCCCISTVVDLLACPREADLLPDEVLVAIILGVNNNHAAAQINSGRVVEMTSSVPSSQVHRTSPISSFVESFNLGIGDGRTFHRVVDVGSEVLNDVAFLEQVNENGLVTLR